MKRLTIILAIAALAMSACSEPSTIGKGLDKRGSDKIATPTPTKKPSVKPKPTKASAKPTAAPAGYKGRPWEIAIRDVGNGYEPRERRVRVGDTITFTNLDPTSKHSFTEDEGKWDSGELAEGEKFVLKVTLPPGTYHFHCEVVPYIVGGPLEVLPNS